MNSWYHAEQAAKKWGGIPDDYYPIECFIDSSKSIIGDVRHRSMYHHTAGVFLCEKIFGTTILVGGQGNSIPRKVPVRLIAELHIMQDLGWIPSPVDYINNMTLKQWMGGAIKTERNLSDIFNLPVNTEPYTKEDIPTPHTQIRQQPFDTYLDKPARREKFNE